MNVTITDVPFKVKSKIMNMDSFFRKYVEYLIQNKKTLKKEEAVEINFGKGVNAKEILSYLQKIHG